MEPIVKPEFKKLMQNIIYSLKNGMKTIYDVLVDVQGVVDGNADSLDDFCEQMADNENARISAELGREEAESHRVIEEQSREEKFSEYSEVLDKSAELQKGQLYFDRYDEDAEEHTQYKDEDGNDYAVINFKNEQNHAEFFARVPSANKDFCGVMSHEDKNKIDLFETLFADDIAARSEEGLSVGVDRRNTLIGVLHIKSTEHINIRCGMTGDIVLSSGDGSIDTSESVINGQVLALESFGSSKYVSLYVKEDATFLTKKFSCTVWIVPNETNGEITAPELGGNGGTFPGTAS